MVDGLLEVALMLVLDALLKLEEELLRGKLALCTLLMELRLLRGKLVPDKLGATATVVAAEL